LTYIDLDLDKARGQMTKFTSSPGLVGLIVKTADMVRKCCYSYIEILVFISFMSMKLVVILFLIWHKRFM